MWEPLTSVLSRWERKKGGAASGEGKNSRRALRLLPWPTPRLLGRTQALDQFVQLLAGLSQLLFEMTKVALQRLVVRGEAPRHRGGEEARAGDRLRDGLVQPSRDALLLYLERVDRSFCGFELPPRVGTRAFRSHAL